MGPVDLIVNSCINIFFGCQEFKNIQKSNMQLNLLSRIYEENKSILFKKYNMRNIFSGNFNLTISSNFALV